MTDKPTPTSIRDLPLAEAYERLEQLEILANAAERWRPGPWHAVHEANTPPYDDVDPVRDPVWTVSHREGEAGWRTDGGFPGYGLPRSVAAFVAACDPATVRDLVALARRGLGGKPCVDYEDDEVVGEDGTVTRVVSAKPNFLAFQGYRQPDLVRVRFLLAGVVENALAEHGDDRGAVVAAVREAVAVLPFALDAEGRHLLDEWLTGRLGDAAFLEAVLKPAQDGDRPLDGDLG